ncbi:energy-coupling factor transporter transmembrane component T [Microbacterium soli]|uniref:Energy-coupling factor transporter transmembrane protein EcfT n=1 Tax=Microbacterium soli TaxID=446075 RepID=A0ABP7NJQ7_9MICO
MISLYRPGAGPAHRMPAGAKLAVLALCALVLSLLRLGVIVTPVVLLVVTALYPAVGLPLRAAGEAWWRLRWLILVLGAALWIFTSTQEAVTSTGRVVALLLLAELVTRTTRMGDLLDVFRRIALPLRRIGVDPEALALTLSLTIAMIPVIAGLAAQVREAQRARGIRLGPRAVLPLLVLTMRHADEVGEALAARGLAR